MGIFSSRAIVIDAVLVTMAMLVASVHTSERAELIATVAKAEEALGVAPAAPEWPERTVLAFVTPWVCVCIDQQLVDTFNNQQKPELG